MGKMAETSLGGWAECTARQLLEAHDFQILSQNFHSRYGEIDLSGVKKKIAYQRALELTAEKEQDKPDRDLN